MQRISKKVIALLFLIICVAWFYPYKASAEADVTAETEYTAYDLVLLQQCLLGIGVETDFDLNGDGITDTADAVIVQTKILGMDYISRKVSYPTDFVCRLKPDIYFSETKGYYTSFDIKEHKIVKEAGVTCYVSPTGDDANSGLNEQSPFKTINKALNVENIETVYLLEGTYKRGTNFTPKLDFGGVNVIGIGDVIIDGSSVRSGISNTTSSAYIENIKFTNAVTVQTTLTDADTVYLYKCEFSRMGNNGLSATGGNYYVVECSAYDNAIDGLNYHKSSAGSFPNVVEINCTAYNNGDGNDSSSNATTVHDGASIIRVGGDYHDCFGGVVADKGVSSDRWTYSCNFGVKSYKSVIDLPEKANYNSCYWASAYCKMWLYDCFAADSTYSIHASHKSEVYVVSDADGVLSQPTCVLNGSKIIVP